MRLKHKRDQQISAIESQKETESKYQIQQEALDKQITDTEKQYDSIIGDNATWDDIKNSFIDGESGMLNSLMLAMQNSIGSTYVW